MVLMLASAVLNVVLNVLLIPHLGIQGAAIATLISYAFLSGSTLMVSNRRLRVAVPWGMAVKFGVLAIAMYAIVVQVRMPSVTATLVAKIAVGGAFYAILTFVFDRTARDAALAFLGRLRGR
jgi:O-antigen/teichoic acid export membrane protein